MFQRANTVIESTIASYCFANDNILVYFEQAWRGSGDPVSYFIQNFKPTVDATKFNVPC